jgi:prepilin-type N-terminal cleavage/methylation domain-containing protein
MKHRGFTLLETSVALLVLTALTTLCLRFFAAESGQRRQVFAHLAATQEAANVLERVEALNWNELTTASAAKLQLSAQARQTLPAGRVETLVDGPSGTPPAKRVAVAVRWRSQPGEPEREVRLVAWRYKEP